MAKRSSADVGFFLIGGRSVLGTRTKIDVKRKGGFEETTPLGVGAVTRAFGGLSDFELTQDGFFDDAADAINDALVAAQGTTPVVCLGINGNVAGLKFDGFSAPLDVEYERVTDVGKLHKANGAYQGSGLAEKGVILHPHRTETTATNTEGAESVDNAASSANGGAGYLQVETSVLGGFTNFVAKVRHSADDITYADLVTFTAVTVAPASERKTVTGTVNRYLASSWSWGGAGSGQSARFLVGFVRA
jgi:hypothetical protein